MKINRIGLPLFLLSLVLTSLACTIFVGGPDYSSLQQSDKKPFMTDPQVYLRDGQMQIYGKTQQGIFAANIGIVVSVGVDPNGQPLIEMTSADFGPFPAPEGLKDTISAMIREAYTGSLGPVATGLRIETISIADGVMTITGRIR